VTAERDRHRSFLNSPRSRRDAVFGGGAVVAALGSLSWRHAVAAQATPLAAAPGSGLLLVQSFSQGSLFPTQGDWDILPYTVILWEAAARGFFFVDGASGAAGVIPAETVVSAIGAGDGQARAVLAAPMTAENDAAASQPVWVLQLGYGGLGSDPDAVTYQGEPLPADEAAAWLGAAPAALPDAPQDLGAGYLIIAGLAGVDTSGGAGVRLTMDMNMNTR